MLRQPRDDQRLVGSALVSEEGFHVSPPGWDNVDDRGPGYDYGRLRRDRTTREKDPHAHVSLKDRHAGGSILYVSVVLNKVCDLDPFMTSELQLQRVLGIGEDHARKCALLCDKSREGESENCKDCDEGFHVGRDRNTKAPQKSRTMRRGTAVSAVERYKKNRRDAYLPHRRDARAPITLAHMTICQRSTKISA